MRIKRSPKIQVTFKSSPTFPSAESWRDRSPLSIWHGAIPCTDPEESFETSDTALWRSRCTTPACCASVLSASMHARFLVYFISTDYRHTACIIARVYGCTRFKTEYTHHIQQWPLLRRLLDDETKIVDTSVPSYEKKSIEFSLKSDGIVWKFWNASSITTCRERKKRRDDERGAVRFNYLKSERHKGVH